MRAHRAAHRQPTRVYPFLQARAISFYGKKRSRTQVYVHMCPSTSASSFRSPPISIHSAAHALLHALERRVHPPRASKRRGIRYAHAASTTSGNGSRSISLCTHLDGNAAQGAQTISPAARSARLAHASRARIESSASRSASTRHGYIVHLPCPYRSTPQNRKRLKRREERAITQPAHRPLRPCSVSPEIALERAAGKMRVSAVSSSGVKKKRKSVGREALPTCRPPCSKERGSSVHVLLPRASATRDIKEWRTTPPCSQISVCSKRRPHETTNPYLAASIPHPAPIHLSRTRLHRPLSRP
jgi:hypothetical protein